MPYAFAQWLYDEKDHMVKAWSANNSSHIWCVSEAKAKFSEVLARAQSEGPQTITLRGRTKAVVIGAEDWERKTNRVGNLAEFFAASSLRRSGLKLRRVKERPRKVNL